MFTDVGTCHKVMKLELARQIVIEGRFGLVPES